MVDISLILPDLSTLPDVGEPLQHNHVSRVEAIDDAAADVMVEPSHKATLSPRKPPQESFSSLGRVGLECRPLGLIPPADVHSLSAAESQTVATGCQVDDAKVNAYDFSQFSRRWNGLTQDDMDVESSLASIIDKRGRRGVLPLEQRALIVADPEQKPPGSPSGRQRHLKPLPSINDDLSQAKDALVVVHTRWPKVGGLALELQLGSDPGDGTDGQVGRQAEALTDLMIAEVLEPDFIRGSVLFSCLKDVVARFSKLMQRILKSFMVLRVNLQLAADGLNKFHRRKHITYVGGVKAGTFLPA